MFIGNWKSKYISKNHDGESRFNYYLVIQCLCSLFPISDRLVEFMLFGLIIIWPEALRKQWNLIPQWLAKQINARTNRSYLFMMNDEVILNFQVSIRWFRAMFTLKHFLILKIRSISLFEVCITLMITSIKQTMADWAPRK